jgi:hypothetical protein
MLHAGTTRLIVTSTAFSGVGCPEIADDILHHSWVSFIADNHDGPVDRLPTAVTFQPEFCIEWDRKCQAELALLPNRPKHLFGNILDAVPTSLRRSCGLDGGSELPPDQLRAKLAYCTPILTMWCLFCNAYCTMTTCHQHRAGSPCQDHSQLGNRAGMSGCKAKYFFIWIALCRALLFTVIVHENVPGFGLADMVDLLGDLYVIIRIELCPSTLGWASCRPRQACICLLRAWIFPVMKDGCSSDQRMSDAVVVNAMDFQNALLNIFGRVCQFTFADYFVATAAERSADKRWARARPLVRRRRLGIRHAQDSRYSFPTSYTDYPHLRLHLHLHDLHNLHPLSS